MNTHRASIHDHTHRASIREHTQSKHSWTHTDQAFMNTHRAGFHEHTASDIGIHSLYRDICNHDVQLLTQTL